MSFPFVYFQVAAAKCIVEMRVNGFLLSRSIAKYPVSLNYPVNTELIGQGNVATLTLYPTLLDNNTLSGLDDIVAVGTVKIFPPDSIVAPETGEMVGQFDFTRQIEEKKITALTLADLASLFPLTEVVTFDNEGGSFRNRFVDAQPITDENALRAYGMKLLGLLRSRDTQGLFEEYRYKLDDYKVGYDPPELNNPERWFADFLEKDFYPGMPITEFRPEDLILQPMCDNRIWKIGVKPDLPLFQNRGDDGDVNTMDIYVGLVDGNLRILR